MAGSRITVPYNGRRFQPFTEDTTIKLFSALSVAAVLLAVFLPAIPAAAQTDDAAMEKFLARQAARCSERVFDGAITLKEWQERRPRFKQEYLYMLGLWPLPEKTPLEAKITGTLERDGFIVDKLHFQSRPGLYVTGNLYRPKKAEGKLPAVLYVCGHSGRGRNGNKTAFQDHGMWFASNGYICLIIDTLQLGEVPGMHHGTYSNGRMWWQGAGYTPAGVECWNGIRAIDYLINRPDVDAERLAVTGISGGGAATFWIAAADERVKCAVPVSGMSDLESYVSNKIINGHCDCMFLVNAFGWEWTTIACLVAPRPLLFANSDMDPIFPMDGNRRIIDRLRKLYKLHGKPELVDEYVSKGGHAYRPDLRVAIFQWINKHIKNDTSPVKDADFKPYAGEELRAFPEDLPADQINSKVDSVFVPRVRPKLPEAGKFDDWKRALLHELQDKSFRWPAERVPPARSGGETTLITDEGIQVVLGSAIERKELPENPRATLVVLNPGEKLGPRFVPEWMSVPNWVAGINDARDALTITVSVRGIDVPGQRAELSPTIWTRKSPPNYFERSMALVGTTADAGRVWDIAATVRYLDEERKGKYTWRVLGRGQAGVLAAYAALFEPSIKEVVIFEPPTSHTEGPIFLNVLRTLDIPDALGLLAPRPLTLVNTKDNSFARTEQIYKLAGAGRKLVIK
jgi:cephalosporin-C deacetylase-like acetyl esterase